MCPKQNLFLIILLIHSSARSNKTEDMEMRIKRAYVTNIITPLDNSNDLFSKIVMFLDGKSHLLKMFSEDNLEIKRLFSNATLIKSDVNEELNSSPFRKVVEENYRMDTIKNLSSPNIILDRVRLNLENVFTVGRNIEKDEFWRNHVGDFIVDQFRSHGHIVGIQMFPIKHLFFKAKPKLFGKNVFGIYPGSRWGTSVDRPIIIGAHWDTTATTDGYNDNGSGAAGILEISRAFSKRPNGSLNTVIFVAFDSEENGLQGSLYFVEKFLISKILIPFGIPTIGGAFILDTILNYNSSINSQFFGKDWALNIPKVSESIKKHSYKGDFVAVIQRDYFDENLAAKLNKYSDSSTFRFENFKLYLNKKDYNTSLFKYADFFTSDHSRFWFTKNQRYKDTLKAVLITDTGPNRGLMKECYHSACDSIRNGSRGKFANYDFYTYILRMILATVHDMAGTSSESDSKGVKYRGLSNSASTVNNKFSSVIFVIIYNIKTFYS